MSKTSNPNPALLDAARRVAQAEAVLTKATAALHAEQKQQDVLSRRIQALQEACGGIIARRQQGEQRPDDGAQLELIAADLEGISTLLTEAEAAVMVAQKPVETASSAVQAARYALQRTENELAEAALIAHAQACEAVLLETIGQLETLRRPLDRHQPVWGPSPAFKAELHRLQVQRGFR